jgi:putative transposase
VAEVCGEYSISSSTYFNWKAKFGGMTASDIKRLRELEEENRQLKRMFADMSLENRALKDLIEKKAGDGRAPRGRHTIENRTRDERAAGGRFDRDVEDGVWVRAFAEPRS